MNGREGERGGNGYFYVCPNANPHWLVGSVMSFSTEILTPLSQYTRNPLPCSSGTPFIRGTTLFPDGRLYSLPPYHKEKYRQGGGSYRPQTLRLWCASEPPGGLVKAQFLAPTPEFLMWGAENLQWLWVHWPPDCPRDQLLQLKGDLKHTSAPGIAMSGPLLDPKSHNHSYVYTTWWEMQTLTRYW
jgi:hypothetical protein